MKFEKLGNIARIQIGKTPPRGVSKYWGKGNSWVSISDLKSATINSTKEEITDLAISECGCKVIPKGTLMMSFKLSIGKVAFAGRDLFTNEAICGIILKDKSKVAAEYLFYALKNTKFVGSNVAVKGSTLNTSSLNALQIPIIEGKKNQLHIADLLSKAENLIARRKESIRLLDEFLKSTFFEMFGDPVRNEKGFKRCRFDDFIIEIVAGSSYGGEQKGFLKDDEYGVLKVSAVTWGVFNPKEFKVVNKKDIRGEIIHPKKGNLLFSRANTRELVGATCIVDNDYPRLFIPDKLWKLVLKAEELNNVFTHYLFQNKSFKNTLTREASGTSSSMLNISMEKLKKINFYKPPIELQSTFAQIVEKTEALKTQYQQSLQELENLYGSLSQRAFRGEL
ncbi:MAG TPA: restriction endonuclease subunit S [Bacteroidales bacterium]|nr:restriction endonuclease subunit S [Bacteroidales bacterium]HRZ48894.1 restriction endonuclease subunit S [Bacteroidales bacterium]